jgi:hypothetical protein
MIDFSVATESSALIRRRRDRNALRYSPTYAVVEKKRRKYCRFQKQWIKGQAMIRVALVRRRLRIFKALWSVGVFAEELGHIEDYRDLRLFTVRMEIVNQICF